MRRFRIDEMVGKCLVNSHVASAETALAAAKSTTGLSISHKALQLHWFRVVDEEDGAIYEYGATRTGIKPDI